ncbi:MAG: TlpA family protein disulfide reductase [Acidimicrobiia bacterium]
MTDEQPSPGPEPEPGLAVGSSRLLSGRRILHVTLLLIIVVPVAVWLLRPQTSELSATGSEVGESAPDFTVGLFDGTVFTLSSHLADDGRPVVLNFWASWCVPCRVEMPAIDTVARQRPDILFLGVAVQDTETTAQAFSDEIGVGYPLGYDSDGTILESYPILGLPATWYITGDGVVAGQWFGQLDETTLTEFINRNT